MSTCDFCYDNSTSIYTCPNYHNKVCYQCLLNSVIHNNDKCLCPFCDYEFTDIFKTSDTSYDVLSITSECILCYDSCYHPIKCETCHHSYCKECFKRLIETNKAHPICAYCRQPFSKTFIDESLQEKYPPVKSFIDIYDIHKVSEKGGFEAPYDINDELITCKHCKEHFEYDTLAVYFKSKIKCNPDYKPECIHCHKEFDDISMFLNIKLILCDGVLKIKDPKGCEQCNNRYHHTYTCKYCYEEVCKEYMLTYLKEKYEKKEELDCVKCHHKYSDEDLNEIFGKETCKKELHLKKFNSDCVICCKDIINRNLNDIVHCEFCNKNICFWCVNSYLEEKAKEYKRNNPKVKYIQEGFYDCPYCKHKWTNEYIYNIYNNYSVGRDYFYTNILRLIKPVIICSECNKDCKYYIQCKTCKKYRCYECVEHYLLKHFIGIKSCFEKSDFNIHEFITGFWIDVNSKRNEYTGWLTEWLSMETVSVKHLYFSEFEFNITINCHGCLKPLLVITIHVDYRPYTMYSTRLNFKEGRIINFKSYKIKPIEYKFVQ